MHLVAAVSLTIAQVRHPRSSQQQRAGSIGRASTRRRGRGRPRVEMLGASLGIREPRYRATAYAQGERAGSMSIGHGRRDERRKQTGVVVLAAYSATSKESLGEGHLVSTALRAGNAGAGKVVRLAVGAAKPCPSFTVSRAGRVERLYPDDTTAFARLAVLAPGGDNTRPSMPRALACSRSDPGLQPGGLRPHRVEITPASATHQARGCWRRCRPGEMSGPDRGTI